jgi:hypothetical protein
MCTGTWQCPPERRPFTFLILQHLGLRNYWIDFNSETNDYTVWWEFFDRGNNLTHFWDTATYRFIL